MKKNTAIVWFRADLRIHDNEALITALKMAEEVIPVFVFDERVYGPLEVYPGIRKTGSFRAKFVLESVQCLKESLQALGSDLVIRIGKPEEELFQLAQQVKSSWVFCNRERTFEEEAVQDSLEKQLWTIGQEVIYTRGKMLFYTQDLPFPVTHTPEVFTQFRKEVEHITPVREPLPSPGALPSLPLGLDPGMLPTLADLQYDAVKNDPRSVIEFKGGEKAALERLQYYIWESRLISHYKETRNGLVGGDYSSKFSAWLSQGCLSPKLVYQELKRFESLYGATENTYWLLFELYWRDFFRLMAKKYGNRIFAYSGIRGKVPFKMEASRTLFELWKNGLTGIPFVDANMRELNATGYMSNRGRQNVASFLVKDLRVDWRWGAAYFESQLIDYDVASNWVNWNYIVGIGNDPREDRYFNILSQARKYDPKGTYVKLWVPELDPVPVEKIHRPDTLSVQEQDALHVVLGKEYPMASVDTAKWN